MNNFNQKCYDLVKHIPKGKVTTYKEVAKALDSKAWRAVGHAMANNKNLQIIPCHRVVCSDGHVGQYVLGTDKKIEILEREGVAIKNNKVENFEKMVYTFSTEEA